jgi:hypothetical protein
LHQDALGHIVTMVPGCHGGELVIGPDVEQGAVSRSPPRRLAALARGERRFQLNEVKRDLLFVAQSLAESRISVRLVPSHCVVDVGRLQCQFEIWVAEEVQQGHGIRAPGERHQDSLADELREPLQKQLGKVF